jgi:hypothetical protein
MGIMPSMRRRLFRLLSALSLLLFVGTCVLWARSNRVMDVWAMERRCTAIPRGAWGWFSHLLLAESAQGEITFCVLSVDRDADPNAAPPPGAPLRWEPRHIAFQGNEEGEVKRDQESGLLFGGTGTRRRPWRIFRDESQMSFFTRSGGYGLTVTSGLAVRDWLLTALLSVAPGLTLLRAIGKRFHPPDNAACPVCGYDLRATPGRCPECGNVPAAKVNA